MVGETVEHRQGTEVVAMGDRVVTRGDCLAIAFVTSEHSEDVHWRALLEKTLRAIAQTFENPDERARAFMGSSRKFVLTLTADTEE